MIRLAVVAVVCTLLGGCASQDERPPSTSAASMPSAAVAAPPVYEIESCPVLDEAFCVTAIEVIDPLRAGDAERLFALSRESRLVCANLATEYFPACERDDVLRGYTLAGANFIVDVVDEEGFRGQLDAIVGNLDRAFSDELGDGSVQVLGVGRVAPTSPDDGRTASPGPRP